MAATLSPGTDNRPTAEPIWPPAGISWPGRLLPAVGRPAGCCCRTCLAIRGAGATGRSCEEAHAVAGAAAGVPVALSTASVYPERVPDAFEAAARLGFDR